MYVDPAPAVLDQGTIVERAYFYSVDEERPALVLTPTCDFEQTNAEFVQMCALIDAWELVEALLATHWKKMGLVDDAGARVQAPGKGKLDDLRNSIKQLITQRFPRYHWLAPLPGGDRPLVADFQILTTLTLEDLAETKILAGLRGPFREQAAARYAAYMGRVGTPDFTGEQIAGWIEGGLDELFPK